MGCSGGEVNHSVRLWVVRTTPPCLDVSVVIRPETSKANNGFAAVPAKGGMVRVLMRRLNSSCIRLIVLRVRAEIHRPGDRRAHPKHRSAVSTSPSATTRHATGTARTMHTAASEIR